MSMIVARILMRYLAAALMTAGLLAPEIADQIGADPDIVLLVGTAIAALAEWAYLHARRKGRPT